MEATKTQAKIASECLGKKSGVVPRPYRGKKSGSKRASSCNHSHHSNSVEIMQLIDVQKEQLLAQEAKIEAQALQLMALHEKVDDQQSLIDATMNELNATKAEFNAMHTAYQGQNVVLQSTAEKLQTLESDVNDLFQLVIQNAPPKQ